ncbi:hypothetical protein ADN00_07315 [Ornatilinea apprima]|uniref:Uncharacterized protein n=1 Tax=Ornatilinea apprima TaxID=1134406 RepID=A0A0P6X879_9CHLR|nr:hypothetical protein ADN00_07315 [Ornatilinea apprima]
MTGGLVGTGVGLGGGAWVGGGLVGAGGCVGREVGALVGGLTGVLEDPLTGMGAVAVRLSTTNVLPGRQVGVKVLKRVGVGLNKEPPGVLVGWKKRGVAISPPDSSGCPSDVAMTATDCCVAEEIRVGVRVTNSLICPVGLEASALTIKTANNPARIPKIPPNRIFRFFIAALLYYLF